MSTHGKAQSKAKQRLVDAHREEYEQLYRDECAKMGLRNYPTKAERLNKLRQQLAELERGV